MLKEWESNDLMLDNYLTIGNITFKYINEVKLYILKNNKNHKFLNKLIDSMKISDTDYDYLMRWYYDRKTHVDTPEEKEKNRIFFEKRKKEEHEKYNQIIELMKNSSI